MPGQHADAAHTRAPFKRGTVLALLLVPFALVVGFIAFLGYGAMSNSPTGSRDSPRTQESVACTGSYRVNVVAAPEVVDVLEDAADRVADAKRSVDGKCLGFDVDSASASSSIAQQAKGSGRLWVADSAGALIRSQLPEGRSRVLRSAIATSPLVLATSQEGAAKLASHKATWEELAAASSMAVHDPNDSGVALSALTAIQQSIGSSESSKSSEPSADAAARLRFGRSVLGLVRNRLPDGVDELETGKPVATTEQRITALRAERPDSDVTAVTPEQGTVLVEYSLIALGDKDDRIDRAGSELVRQLDAELLRKAGFRAPGTSARNPAARLLDGKVDAADLTGIVGVWKAMSMDTNMLAVVDLSGSMTRPAGDGRSRIQLARDAAQRALAAFPESSKIGLWGFSVNRAPGRDHEVLAPVRSLGAAHRQSLAVALTTMVGRTRGGTGLYDTILAGYREALANHQKDRVNSVVLLTDGRNEQDPGGIGKAALLTELRRLADPKRPIAVVFVGMGPEADLPTLKDIAGATGGQAYRATKPADMERIILQAFLQRR